LIYQKSHKTILVPAISVPLLATSAPAAMTIPSDTGGATISPDDKNQTSSSESSIDAEGNVTLNGRIAPSQLAERSDFVKAKDPHHLRSQL
jgi:hypothetical protein